MQERLLGKEEDKEHSELCILAFGCHNFERGMCCREGKVLQTAGRFKKGSRASLCSDFEREEHCGLRSEAFRESYSVFIRDRPGEVKVVINSR